MFYTGVGSREQSEKEAKRIIKVGAWLDRLGYSLRSGHAKGADHCFELGMLTHTKCLETSEIYLPSPGFNRGANDERVDYIVGSQLDNLDEAREILRTVMPWIDKVKGFALDAHTRNVYQVLGKDLDNPSNLLVACSDWDKPGISVKGGTRTAWALAKENSVPSFNIRYIDEWDKLVAWLKMEHLL